MVKIILIIAAVILVGGGAYFVLNQNSNNSPTSTSADITTALPQNESSSNQSFAGSLKDLIRLGKNYTCNFDNLDDAGNRTSGTVFVAASGNKLNGSFTMTQADGQTYDGNVIRDGEYNYIWTSLESQGYKTKIDPADTSLFGEDKDSDKSVGLNEDENVNFDCSPWVVNNSRFTPPSNIEFLDLSQTMMQMEDQAQDFMQQDTQDVMQDKCSACDQIPAGSTRDQCLQALGC